jgi:NAD(P)-dependent dehydrogenase (short-subunit alcohol dehydrogenase family)
MAVGVADINAEKAQAVAAEIRKAGGAALAIQADVSDEESVNGMFDAFLNEYGRINYLAANAGIFIYGDFLSFSYEDWRTIMAVNVDGMLLCCRRAAKEMIRQGAGRGPYSIMLGLSQGSFSQDPPSAAYITSKWAGRGLMRSMALGLAKYDITVNGIGPGSVLTDLHRYVNGKIAEMNGMTVEAATEMMGKIYPLKGYQPAEEMAAIYSFAFSDRARNMTGMTIMDDGGNVMT